MLIVYGLLLYKDSLYNSRIKKGQMVYRQRNSKIKQRGIIMQITNTEVYGIEPALRGMRNDY